jgi:magnesium transporter
MNFEHMPELKWRHGYFVTLGVLGLLGLALFLLFRGLGWVGTGRTRAGRSTPP